MKKNTLYNYQTEDDDNNYDKDDFILPWPVSAPPCPYKRLLSYKRPPSQDRQHSSWSLSNLQTTLCTAHQEEKEQQSASSLCCVQVLFALYTVLIISCAVVCAIVVLPPMSGVIQCAVCIIQCAMCIIQDGQHPPQSFSESTLQNVGCCVSFKMTSVNFFRGCFHTLTLVLKF